MRLEGQQPSTSINDLSLAVLPCVSGPHCAEYCAVLSTPSELTDCKLTIQPTITVCQSLRGHEAIMQKDTNGFIFGMLSNVTQQSHGSSSPNEP